MKRKFSFLLVAAACFCGGEVANGQSDDRFFYTAQREKDTQLLNSTREKAEQGDAEAQSLLSWMYSAGFYIGQDYAEAAKWLRKLAEQGDAESQNNLGRVYAYGEVGPNDNVEAAKWFRKAAEQGLAQAQFNLGWMYEHGQGMPKDEVEAAKWYQKAADQGYGKQNIGYGAKAQNNLGEIFCKLGVMYENDEAEQKNNREAHACVLAALEWYRKAVELGNAKAKNNITRIHYKLGEFEKGRGNRSGTWLWYKEAAWGGHAEAQFKFGEMHTTGGELGWGHVKKTKRLVEGMYKKAAEWYRKAAEQGHAEAQFNLGEMYRNGEGVPQDDGEAAKWYRKAADQGHAEAQFKFEAMQGGAEAQYNLGNRYRDGEGVRQDYGEAANWYRKAADQGHAKAQNSLGVRYAKGQGVRKSYKEAVKWYRKAAAQGYATSQYNLGNRYRDGEGVRQDYGEAAKWYRKAADQGHAKAKKELPECCSRISQAYFNGDGVPKSDIEGYAWLVLEILAIKDKDRHDDLSDFYFSQGEFRLWSEKRLSDLEKRLTAEQIEKGQARAVELHRSLGAK